MLRGKGEKKGEGTHEALGALVKTLYRRMLAEHTLSSAHFKRYSYVSPMEIRIIVAVLTKEGVESIEFSLNFIGCTRNADHLDH